jgi:hypothetical protein
MSHRQDVVLLRFLHEQRLHFLQFLGLCGRQVPDEAEVIPYVVEIPDIVC